MNLSKKNYYSQEANERLMSVSQFKDFFECEALALAKIKGYDPFSSRTPLLVGNYLHSYFESHESFEEFYQENNSEILTKAGNKRVDFVKADEMIERLENDAFFNFLYKGEKEVIITENVFGVDWKARIDCLNIEKGYFVDIKTTREMRKRYWSDKYTMMVGFVEKYDYVLQMAMYKKMLEQHYKRHFTPYIFAVSKETPVDILALELDESRYSLEYSIVEEKIDRFISVKNGSTEAVSCGKCSYCNSTKHLSGFVEIGELIA